MAHKLEQEFCLTVKEKFPSYFTNTLVLDIGSGDVNGNNQYLFTNCFVIGVDVVSGLNVDLVAKAEELTFRSELFDTVISTECFEHNPNWKGTILNACRMLKSKGLFLFTCATTGRPEHGTLKSKTYQSLATQIGTDYYKNLTEEDIRSILIEDMFSPFEFSTKAQDLYFWGIKN